MPAAAIPDFIFESVRALPVLPTAVARLLSLARDVDADFREIARVIETDQTLTARTLRAANSPLNAVCRQVKTIRQATVLLGADTITNLVLGVSVISLQSKLYKNLPVDPNEFGRHSIAVGLTARTLAQHFKLSNPSEAFVAGLLHDIGKLVLLMHYGESYSELMRQARQGNEPLNKLELDAYALDHALVGHVLCLHWNLPPAMVQAVAEHHADPAPRSVADVVSRANDLVKTIQLGDGGNRYVAQARVHGPPRDQVSHDVLRELVLALPRLTRQAEEALGHSTNGLAKETSSASDQPRIDLHVREPGEREILTAMLWSMGYEPVGLHDASPASSSPAASAAPVALLSGVPDADLDRIGYQHRDVPVLDYAAWRAQHHLSPGDAFEVYRLRTWLEASLQEVTNLT